ncbi:hypothetical protein KFK09_003324 [Dendrobium nobile]|uniref:Uncharacterized protein n=1 Tax=Dendrobium nobile TaxID=94219 RepID=A0A8T3C0X4_DENNO|nr:hypothetical protein KFK09_003324 [Dendrobium nobile]
MCKHKLTKRCAHDHERHNGEAVILKRLSDEATLQFVDQPVYCKKPLNKINMEEEKLRQLEELQLGTTTMEEAIDKTVIADQNIKGNIQLVEDEQLELMNLAALSKCLSSIIFLDNVTLVSSILLKDVELFERVGSITYCIKPYF